MRMKLSICVFFPLICSVFGISSVEQMNPCEDSIANVCGMAFPDSYQAVYDVRLCLKLNSEIITKECRDYVEIISPSIVEPCFEDIREFCKNVNPGNDRIQTCLKNSLQKLSNKCIVALSSPLERSDQVIMDNHRRNTYSTQIGDISNLQVVLKRVSRYDMSSYVFMLLEDMYNQLDAVELSLNDIMASLFSSQKKEDSSIGARDDQYVSTIGDDDMQQNGNAN